MLKVPLAQAMKWSVPAGKHNDFKGDQKVICKDVADAVLDVSNGNYTKGTDVLAYTSHGG